MSEDWQRRVASTTTSGTPHQRPDTVQAVNAILDRVMSISSIGKITRAEAHNLVDACYDLAAHAGHPDDVAEDAARAVGQVLAVGAFGWTESQLCLLDRDWDSLEEVPALWRVEFLLRLCRSPHILPRQMIDQVVNAFAALNLGDGHIPRIFRPSTEPGRGRNPKAARGTEELLWCWITWQHAEGEKVDLLVVRVAAAVGETTDAVKGWRTAWIKRDGLDKVRAELNLFKSQSYGREFFEQGPSLDEMVASWRDSRMPKKSEDRKSS
ncbi:hypothetical protein JMJ56_26210 [Belnapia sp. T18]|uniref:Uncharacterized protein n=1 Tax=Belnapia arida TaxID=2804533 RepID=A0ABS1UBJ2_9PROT|nr:hypothetical protein [Belnapia arida]MBL6081490.1 hypothetical protein [Belnapia arida]